MTFVFVFSIQCLALVAHGTQLLGSKWATSNFSHEPGGMRLFALVFPPASSTDFRRKKLGQQKRLGHLQSCGFSLDRRSDLQREGIISIIERSSVWLKVMEK